MPRLLGSLLTLVSQGCVSSASDVAWRLAAPGQSCTTSCGQVGTLACQNGHWPITGPDVQTIASSLQFTCTGTQNTEHSMGPAVNDEGMCFFPGSASRVSCAQAPPTSYRLLCPCGSISQQPAYVLAHRGSTCTEACQQKGGLCHSHRDAWPATQPDMDRAVQMTGHSCYTPSSWPSSAKYAPYVDGTSCYWAASASASLCDAESSRERRVCPCLGVQATVASHWVSTAAGMPSSAGSSHDSSNGVSDDASNPSDAEGSSMTNAVLGTVLCSAVVAATVSLVMLRRIQPYEDLVLAPDEEP